MDVPAEPAPTTTADVVWRDLAGPLRSFIRARVADPDATDDLVAEVLLRIHRRRDQLQDDERVTAWVFRIARNVVIDHYRRTGRRPERIGDLPDAPSPDVATDAWVDDQSTVLADLSLVLRPIVHELPPDYRRAIELTDLGGATQAEAARLEGISLSGMKSRVQRGRRQVAVLLEQHCDITLDAVGMPLDCTPRTSGCACGPTSSA